MTDHLQTKVAVVLVGPQGAGNLGSVARVMANFGFSDLRLVAPVADPSSDEALRMAVKAAPLLARARRHAVLCEALADCSYAIGTTRRFGKYREDFLAPDGLATAVAGHLGAGRVALVFGREDSGLTTAELDLCQAFLTIPTDEQLPSLNLAQAVAITLHALAGAGLTAAVPGAAPPAAVASLEAMFEHMRATLLAIDFLDPQNPDHILRVFRRIFGRAGLSERDVRVLQGLWSRIDWVEQERRRNTPGEGGA